MPDTAALPKHVQLSELLMREIVAGRLRDGERLPPEREMASSLGVSVGTLRKALAVLTERALLERVQGSGNYIRAGGDTGGLYAMFRLERPEGGGLPRAEVLGIETLRKPEGLPRFGSSPQASRIRRIRYLDQTPVALEEIWLDGALGPLTRDAVSESLYRTYQKQLGVWISRAEDRVGVAPIPDWTPAAFPMKPAQPAGHVERLSWSGGKDPIEYSQTWFDPGKARYVQRMQ